MAYKIDLTGKRFGRLSVLYYVGQTQRHESIWHCRCDCGNELDIRQNPLNTGHTKSCGCYRKELDEKRKGNPFYKTHGLRGTKLYSTWCNIKARCNNQNQTYYSHYGGRGIKVCKEWENDFETFYSWAMNNGYKDGLTIDRINNNGNYEPSNCRWVDRFVQANNKRNNYVFEYNGEKKTIHEWSRLYNIDNSCLRWRLDNGWDIERALKEPSHKKKVV